MSEQLLTFDMTAHLYIYEFFKRFFVGYFSLNAFFTLSHFLFRQHCGFNYRIMEYRQKKVTHTSSAGAEPEELIDSFPRIKMCIGAFQIIPFWKYLEVALPVYP